ncbi:MAG: Fic family protein [Nitrospirae bacterium]|nr:Fic family protein [Nitrospirota bacterium]
MAYQWDHHCHELFEATKGKFQHVLRELGELDHQDVPNPSNSLPTVAWQELLFYFKKWHYNQDLFNCTIAEIDRKVHVINSLGYRGYGVNIDLLNAIDALKKDHEGHIRWRLQETFKRHLGLLKETIDINDKQLQSMDSVYIIAHLCDKLKWSEDEHLPAACRHVKVDLELYLRIMSDETPWTVNTAIFQKLFLHLGCSSMTIMKGTVGHEDTLTPGELKVIGNQNFIEMYKETFSNLHSFTDIGLDLLKRIHLTFSKGLVPNAGNFRPYDFPDRNGVTCEFGNFAREISDLGYVLWETSQNFHNLDSFIYDLSRSYYMFIGIHPFWDSNGRVGKCFLNYMLLKKGIPPISFNNSEEVFALPRYGGSMEDMYNYIKKRILFAVDAYFYERWKLEYLGFLNKQIYNVSFDSGFYFRQIDDSPQRLETHFIAYVVNNQERPGATPLFEQLVDQCRVVLPNELLVQNITIYGGFTKGHQKQWHHCFTFHKNIFIKEVATDIPGARAFDIDFVIDLYDYHYDYPCFSCCVVSQEGGYIFNNKGLNYNYTIQR